jgi:PAS domain S-box-containing protein
MFNKDKELISKLKKELAEYKLIAENALDVIWTMDLKMNFTFVTPSVKDMLGYEVEEFLHTNLAEHATKKEFAKMSWEVAKALKDVFSFKYVMFETKVLHKDGHEIPVEILGKLLKDENGHVNMIHGVTRNISERKKTQAILQEKIDELEKINEVVVGREMKMIELKEENEKLRKLLDENDIKY